MHKSLLSASLLALALAAPLAHAHTAGDIIVRAGAITVNPTADSSSVKVDQGPLKGADLGGKATMSSDTQLGLNFAYMISNNLAIELLAASPFEHVGSFTVLNGAEGVTGALAQIIQQAGALSNMARETLMTPTGVNGSANGKAPSGNGAKPSTKAVVPLGETQPRKERQTARSAAAGARAEERGASGEAAH